MQREIEIYIAEKLKQINKLILAAESDGQELTLATLSHVLKKESFSNHHLSDYLDASIRRLRSSGRIETANVLQATKNAWCRFFKKEHFSIDDINYTSLRDFEVFCSSNGNMPNTIFLYLRTLKTAINTGIKEGVISEKHQPFKDFSLAKYRNVKTQKRAISREELKAVEEMSLETNSSLYHSRNYFLFSFYTGGMNFIDLALLKWENIFGDHLSYVRKKTNEVINVPLMGPARQILELYRSTTLEKKSSFVFPILSEKYTNPASISNRLDRMNKIVNRDLRQIGSALGFRVKLTTYVARHTFATTMKKNGVPVSIIGQALGHEDEKTTQVYLDSFNMDILQQAFDKLL